MFGRPLSLLLALTTALPFAARPALAQPQPDTAIQFLGWSPEGTEYGVVRHETVHGRSGRPEHSARFSVVAIDGKLGEHEVLVDEPEVMEYVTGRKFAIAPLAKRQVDTLAWVFTDSTGRDILRYTVVIGAQLLFELATRDADGNRLTLVAGAFDDLYTEFVPDVFVAPGGGKALLIVGLRTTYRYEAQLWLFPLQADDEVASDALEALVAEVRANAPEQPADAEPALAEGDVVIDWQQTEAVAPVVPAEEAATTEPAVAPVMPEPPAAPVATATPPAEPTEPDDPASATSEASTPDIAPEPEVTPDASDDAEPLPEVLAPEDQDPLLTEPDPASLLGADTDIVEPPPEIEPTEAEFYGGHMVLPPGAPPTPSKAKEPPPTTTTQPTVAKARPPAPAPPEPPAPEPEAVPEATPEVAPLLGFVRESDLYQGNPVVGARVTLDTGETATTDKRGLFRLVVPVSAYQLTITAPGYQTVIDARDMSPGIDNWNSVVLERKTATPPR